MPYLTGEAAAKMQYNKAITYTCFSREIQLK